MDDNDIVLAFQNRDDYHYVADNTADLLDRLKADGEIEIGADQCDACGSFDPETGEPGRGFVVSIADLRAAYCACCNRRRPLTLARAAVTVFPF